MSRFVRIKSYPFIYIAWIFALFSLPYSCQSVPCNASNNSASNSKISCKEIWAYSAKQLRSHPVCMGNTVFLLKGNNVVALNMSNGKELWSRDLSSIIWNGTSYDHIFPRICYLSIKNGTNPQVLVSLSDKFSGYLIAFNPTSGKILWNYSSFASADAYASPRGQICSEPVVWRDRVIFRTYSGLTAVKLSDGKELWNVPFDASIRIPATPTSRPALDKKTIYFNSDFGLAYAFNPMNGSLIWRTITDGIDIKNSSGVRDVHITFSNCYPLVIDNRVLIADGLGNAYGLNKNNGAIVWKKKFNYIFRYFNIINKLYMLSDKGFYELNVNNGAVIHKYIFSDGFLSCKIIGKSVVLINMPRVTPGWQIFDIQRWAVVKTYNDFACTSISNSGKTIYLDGYIPSDETHTPRIRAYRISGL
ncbi:MAG: PQQ-binding-like beta-propeller repeat protein [Capsulimonas sp.]|uniref:PQQ-binding-like beta-propeller repeat protein n=1 Tax=Capsulimonas sp. TaxID=2494211 RepID=UPI003263CC50